MNMLRPKVITEPAAEPVTAAEVFSYSRITLASELADVEKLITCVRRHLEHRADAAFIEQTLEIALDAFPAAPGIITLPRATPLLSVVHVKYLDSAGAEFTVDPATYVLDTYSRPGRICPGYGLSWPTFTPYPMAAVRIRYRAGHEISSSPSIPYPDADVEEAIKLLVGHFYEHREGVIIGETATIESRQMELAIRDLMIHHEGFSF